MPTNSTLPILRAVTILLDGGAVQVYDAEAGEWLCGGTSDLDHWLAEAGRRLRPALDLANAAISRDVDAFYKAHPRGNWGGD
jgi:hypothetical protein